jgi:hypothetical protein
MESGDGGHGYERREQGNNTLERGLVAPLLHFVTINGGSQCGKA